MPFKSTSDDDPATGPSDSDLVAGLVVPCRSSCCPYRSRSCGRTPSGFDRRSRQEEAPSEGDKEGGEGLENEDGEPGEGGGREGREVEVIEAEEVEDTEEALSVEDVGYR